MIKRFAKIGIALAGGSMGYGLFILLKTLAYGGIFYLPQFQNSAKTFGFMVTLIMIVAIIFYIVSPWILERGLRVARKTEGELEKIPTNQILVGTFGLIVGLVIAFLIGGLIRSLLGFINLAGFDILASLLIAAVYAFMGYLGVSVSTRKINDFSKLSELFKSKTAKGTAKNTVGSGKPKILDTSVIIDGRIADISRTGFIEGPLIIAEFVLEELRHIADSSDGLKRNRGRRGLDILRMIQQELPVEVRIVGTDFEDVAEVDIKLLKLAMKMEGVVVTNDYNLNKVADLQGVPVLNINELANAVKPVVLPGEEMQVTLIKEGKESNQGVAYLDDGTMIVVENGRKHIGETMGVLVTSVLQTAAGRMIFAKPKMS